MGFSFTFFVLVTINLSNSSPIPQNPAQQSVMSNGATFTPVAGQGQGAAANTPQLATMAAAGIPLPPTGQSMTMLPGGQVFLGPTGQLMTGTPQGAPLGSVVLPNTATPSRTTQTNVMNQPLTAPPVALAGGGGGQLIAPSGTPLTPTNPQANPASGPATNSATNSPMSMTPGPGPPMNLNTPIVPGPGLPMNQMTNNPNIPGSQNLTTNTPIVPGPGLPTNQASQARPMTANNPNQQLQNGVPINPGNPQLGNPQTITTTTQNGRPTTITQTTNTIRPQTVQPNVIASPGTGASAQLNLPFGLGGFGINVGGNGVQSRPVNQPLVQTVETVQTVQVNRSQEAPPPVESDEPVQVNRAQGEKAVESDEPVQVNRAQGEKPVENDDPEAVQVDRLQEDKPVESDEALQINRLQEDNVIE